MDTTRICQEARQDMLLRYSSLLYFFSQLVMTLLQYILHTSGGTRAAALLFQQCGRGCTTWCMSFLTSWVFSCSCYCAGLQRGHALLLALAHCCKAVFQLNMILVSTRVAGHHASNTTRHHYFAVDSAGIARGCSRCQDF